MNQISASNYQNNPSFNKNVFQLEPNEKIDVKMIPTFDMECPSIKNHSAIHYKDTIYIFGGYNGQKNLNKLHILNLRTNTWEQAKFTNDANDLPRGRNGHTSVVIGNKMYVIGGWIGQGQHASNQLYILDLDLLKWTKMQTTGQEPGPCNMHIAEYYENKIYVYRGGDGKQYFSDLHSLNINTLVWEKVITKGDEPPPRANHSSTLIKDYIYIFGGWNGQKRLNDLYKLDLKTLEWQQIDSSEWQEAPPARAGMKMVNVDNSIYMFGGSGPSSTCYNDLWLYEPTENQWHQCRVSLTDNEQSNISYECNDQSGDNMNKPLQSHSFSQNNLFSQTTRPNQNNTQQNNNEIQNKNKSNSISNQSLENYLNPRSGHSLTLHKNFLFIIGGSWGPNYYKNFIVLDIDPKPDIIFKNDNLNDNQNNFGFLSNIKQFYNNPLFSDVQFSFEGEILYAHKIIISLLGESFNTMFTVGMKETHKNVIEIKNIDLQIFKIILKSLYYNNLELSQDEQNNMNILFEVLRVCDQFLIESMIIMVQQKIKDLITKENIEDILQFSIKYNASFLIKYCHWLQRRNKHQFVNI